MRVRDVDAGMLQCELSQASPWEEAEGRMQDGVVQCRCCLATVEDGVVVQPPGDGLGCEINNKRIRISKRCNNTRKTDAI